jgi:NADPH:quinone reductase
VSLNRGEVSRLRGARPGDRPGWDVAGVVETPAPDGTGPRAGTRVVGLVRSRGWAQRVAVDTALLAPLPADVGDAAAATLPIAGLTALRALRRGGLLLGRRVLVTGAAGGVGRFAVQLAAIAGAAEIHGVARTPEHGKGLADLGATRLLLEDEELAGPYDLILEGVGGASLGRAAAAVAAGGVVVSYAASAPEPAELPPSWYGLAPGASITGFAIFVDLTRVGGGRADLGILTRLVAAGRVSPEISLEASWRDPQPALRALLDRTVRGKAVLHLDDGTG